MLLAVAGLKPEDVKTRTKKLATGDWSDFPPAERAAFGLAYKLSRDPAGFGVLVSSGTGGTNTSHPAGQLVTTPTLTYALIGLNLAVFAAGIGSGLRTKESMTVDGGLIGGASLKPMNFSQSWLRPGLTIDHAG